MVEDDWIQYEAMPVRRTAVRGGAACAQRVPVVRVEASSAGPVRTTRRTTERPAPRTRVRLTRRGRIVLVVLPALAVLSTAIVLGGTVRAQAAPEPPAVTTVVVGTGDSLWSIAERVAPQRDPRDVVASLRRANALDGSTVPAGAVLVLPSKESEG